MNGGAIGQGEGKLNQREALAEIKAVERTNALEIKEAIAAIGGHNLLSEHTGEPNGQYEWLNDIPSIIGGGGVAIAIQEGDRFVGFVLCDHDGNISQFWSAPGKEMAVVQEVLKELPGKGIHQQPKVRISNMTVEGERARDVFRGAGFVEKQKTGEEIVMEKE